MHANNENFRSEEDESLAERATRGPEFVNEPAEGDLSLEEKATRMTNPTRPVKAVPPSENGRYVDPVEIGRGGMGMVWKVYDRKMERLVAVKRVLPNLENYDAIASQFLAEAKALAQLSHQSIVGIFDQGHDAFGDYLVMEYVEGANLLDLIKERTVLSVEDSVRLVRKICEGLHDAHLKGIIHRDIKPSNILVDKNGRAKLTDFGLASLGVSQAHALRGQVLGTEVYMAPEQYENPNNATAASDQYSLTATLYHMVTGKLPRIIFQNVPEELRDVLVRGLAENPRDRFPSIPAFHLALRQVLKGNTTPKNARSDSTHGNSNLASIYLELQRKAECSLAEAKKLFQAFDDQGALKILQGLPIHLRDRQLEQGATSRWERGQKLEREIQKRVHQFRTEGLSTLLDEFLSLYPNRDDMVKLREQMPQIKTPPANSQIKPVGSVPISQTAGDAKPSATRVVFLTDRGLQHKRFALFCDLREIVKDRRKIKSLSSPWFELKICLLAILPTIFLFAMLHGISSGFASAIDITYSDLKSYLWWLNSDDHLLISAVSSERVYVGCAESKYTLEEGLVWQLIQHEFPDVLRTDRGEFTPKENATRSFWSTPEGRCITAKQRLTALLERRAKLLQRADALLLGWQNNRYYPCVLLGTIAILSGYGSGFSWLKKSADDRRRRIVIRMHENRRKSALVWKDFLLDMCSNSNLHNDDVLQNAYSEVATPLNLVRVWFWGRPQAPQ